MLGDRTGNRVGVYQIAGADAATTLTAVAGSPFATGGTSSITLTFNQDGNFLFVGNGTSRNFTTFNVDASTGALTNRTVQPANTLGAAGLVNGIAYVNFPTTVNADAPVDFNGDGKSDYAVSRQLNPREFYIRTQTGATQFYQFGTNTDVPVPGDYNGDGKTDIAVWRQSSATTTKNFFVRPAGTSGASDFAIQWGQQGDYPAATYNLH